MNHKLVNYMEMWKRNGNTTSLLFALKGSEILRQERRGQERTIVMEYFNSFISPDLLTRSIPITHSLTNDEEEELQ